MHISIRVRLFAALTASALFSLAAISLGFGVANLADDSVRVWMRGWENKRHVTDNQQWEKAYSRLLLAHRLNPLNANYTADLGRLMEWSSWRHPLDDPKYIGERANAEYFYKNAIRARPTWGYAWANFAENRLLQGKFDKKFLHAIEMSIDYGPWEPWVLKKVAWMGMATWDELPERVRPKIKASIRRSVAIESDLNEIVRLAIQYDWLDNLKPMLLTDRQREALRFVRPSAQS